MNRFRFPVFALSLIAAAGCTVTATPAPPDNNVPGTCAQDNTVGCSSPSTGFSCTGSDTPDQSDPSLECSFGEAGNAGSTIFCCLTGENFASSSCAPDDTVAGCGGRSYGFSCTSSDSPDQTDPNLNCSVGVPGNAGSTLYCCQGG